ncbi:hypothetical protein ISN44_As09g033430 [Arabidopsis suecica]|uniref:Uncharacterized protein n=1 Tax=Arabidopsis suecica TaxID=45249 RepID=A0A8T2ANE7_ARASU|nr:hypothetical protein ISN44_As09g033430 [Arabidopsis suecica]
MDPNNRQIILTNRHKDQCVRWDCRRLPLRPLEYCHVSCEQMATSDAQSTDPFLLSTVYTSTSEFALIANKIFNLIKAGKESGVPRLSHQVFQIPPWLSSMFTFEFFDWEDFRQWLFIGSFQILPAASDFKWVEDRSKVYDGVRHCVLKPSPREDNRWKLHQYSSLDPMENAIYVMYCKKVDEPLSAEEDEESAEESEESDSD